MRYLVLYAYAIGLSITLSNTSTNAEPIAPEGTRGPWEVVRKDKGITVLRRTVAGSQLREFQGTSLIEAPVAAVMAVLNDSEHRREWMAESKEQRTLQQLDLTTVILYNRLAAPWPVADRDCVMRATTIFDTAQKMVRIEITATTHPDAPEVKGVVRMPSMVAHWHLSPVDGGKSTKAEYQVHANPGGSLPNWMANLSSKKIPYDTITALARQVKRRQYPAYQLKLESLPEYQALMAASAAAAPAKPVAVEPAKDVPKAAEPAEADPPPVT
jgi:uncharacterized protein YndB with AHSA1/START domain